MGKYNGAVITTAGQNLFASAIAGEQTVTFTTMVSSSYAYPASAELQSLTSLQDVVQTAGISYAGVYNNNVVQVSARFDNTNVISPYLINTLGLYAQLGSDTPVLVAVITAVTPDQMPVEDPEAPSAFIYNVQMIIENASSISVTVNPAGTVNVEQLSQYIEKAGGEAANAVVGSFTSSTAQYPVPAAGDTFKVLFGKIAKFFADIKRAITGLSVNGKTVTYTRADGTTGTFTTQDTTYGVVSKTANGLAPKLPDETTTTKYLRQDGTWVAPPNTTYGLASTSADGLLRRLSNNVSQYLRGDGTWQSLKNNFTTTEEGYGLDARAGKAIYDSSLYSKGSIVSFSTNLNNITAPGVYQIPGSASASNMPSGISYGTLLVIRGDTSASFFNQVLYFPSDGTVAIYTRSSVDSGATWRAWAQVTDASALDNYLKIANITQSQTVTNSGYALDARQANPNVSNSLGAKIATNATNVGTLMSNLVDLKFEHVVKTAVGTGYNSSNQLFFKGKNLSVTNYNGNGFFVILNQAPAPGDPTEGATSLYFLTFSNGNDNGYNITRITGTGYNGAGSTYYPKISVLTSGNIYVHWNALPSGQGNSANIHASIFQLY